MDFSLHSASTIGFAAWLLGSGLLPNSVAAQALSPQEQLELDADRNSQVVTVDRTVTRGTLTCSAGQQPLRFYFNDLETDDGGWSSTGFGDWEWGAVESGVGAICDSPQPEPAGAFSGQNAWATNLDGCYTNADATSTLTQTFDFSSLEAPIELSVWQWLHVFGSFDFAQLRVNGDLLFEEVGSTASTDYAPLVVDLSAYAGLPAVTVEFNVFATAVVNRSGWYLDDIAIDACTTGAPIPESQPVPALGREALVLMSLMLMLVAFLAMRARG